MTLALSIPDLQTLTGPLQYAFFQKGLIVAAVSGALLGFIGVYIVLRGMSYIGHGLSHAIFGGFAAASLVSSSFIYLGAGVWGVSSALAINWVTRKHRISADAAIGVITTASFALGVALLTKYGSSGPSFDNALFGSIYGIDSEQIAMLLLVTLIAAAFVVFRYRSLLFTTFDPEVAAVTGVNVPRTEAILMLILSLSILATLTVIGVTLVAAMLVIPAVVARMVTDSFGRMLVISTTVGAACGLTGMYLSYFAGVPSGTMIVLTGAAVFCVVLAWQGGRAMVQRAIPDREIAPTSVPTPARSRS